MLPPLPAVKDTVWPRNPLDHFVLAGLEAIIRKLPQLLHTDRVDLRILPRVQIKDAGQLFCQRPPRPLGEDGDFGPDVDARLDIEPDSLQPPMVVADVIPNPPRTRLIRDAAARGCVPLDGLGMLVNQGVIGIRLWTGVDADPAVMRDALAEVFSSA